MKIFFPGRVYDGETRFVSIEMVVSITAKVHKSLYIPSQMNTYLSDVQIFFHNFLEDIYYLAPICLICL